METVGTLPYLELAHQVLPQKELVPSKVTIT